MRERRNGKTEEWLAVEWQDGREEEENEEKAGTRQKKKKVENDKASARKEDEEEEEEEEEKSVPVITVARHTELNRTARQQWL